MATVPLPAGAAAALPAGHEWSWDSRRLHKKRAFFSSHNGSIHANLAPKVVPCWNPVQSDFPTSDVSDKKARKEQLWQEFFSDPSQWWDERSTKKSSRDPDFQHKITLEALWIDDWLNPPWVKGKFASMAFDQRQCRSTPMSRVSTTFDNYDKMQKLSDEGRLKEALYLVALMAGQFSEAPKGAFVCLLRGCTRRKALAEGKQVHALIVKAECDTNIFLSNHLIDMYSNCGSVVDALKVFISMPQCNVFSWTAMISAYANNGQYKAALSLFHEMQQIGIEPKKVTCIVVLKACTSIAALKQGQQVHALIVKRGFDSDVNIQTSLINMYAKCGCLKDARELFDRMPHRDVVSWSAMIAAYAQKGLGKEALNLYEQMKREGMEPSKVTLVLLLNACASISALEQGRKLHSLILKKGLESEITVQTSLVDMYAKCGRLEDANELFNNMHQRDVVSWNAMVAGYAQRGLGKEALELYEQMKCEGVEPNKVTLVLLLNACASISALEQGRLLHSLIIEEGLESEITIQNALIDMYAKCGCLNDACKLFNNMQQRNVVTWSAIIAGYAQKGLGKEALDLYEQMKHEGLQANEVTYTCLLSACSHSGLVHEGRHVFESMFKYHGVTPTLEHYGCMVDLLGRAGCLADAEDLILKMPIQPDEVVWMTLLGAAKKHANVEIGRRAFDQIVALKTEKDAAPYLMLIDIYSAAGRIDDIAQLKTEMKYRGLEKMLGCTIEVDNQVNPLVVGD